MKRLTRGANTFGYYLDQLLDQICAALNKPETKTSNAATTAAVGIAVPNSGVAAFTVGAIGGYNTAGKLALATAAGTVPIAARFVSLASTPPTGTLSITTSGVVPIQTEGSPARGIPAWLSTTSPGKATSVRPTTGNRQMLGVFDAKDPVTGLWTLMILFDPQMTRVL
jgi:hypothetical protein